MTRSESGISEIIGTILAILLVIALAVIIASLFLGWAVPLQKTAYLATGATPVTITNASAVRLFLSQGDTVSLAPATTSGLPVKFSLTNGSATYDFVPLPGTAPNGWQPGSSLVLFRNASGSWVADSMESVTDNTGFSNGTWTASIVDVTSNVLIAQHTVYLTGGGAGPSPYPVFTGFTVEAWVKWNQNPAPTADNQKWATLVVDGNTDNNRRYQLQHTSTNSNFEFALVTKAMGGGIGKWIWSTTSPVSGTWYYVTGVYNQTPGTMALYVNGVQQSGTNVDSSGLRASPGLFQVGGPAGIIFNGNPGQRIFTGNIRGLQTYDRAMGAEEIASRFAAGLPDS